MENEEIIEILKRKLFKAENDLNVKSATEKHLIYDNEYLLSESNRLIEESTLNKDTIEKMTIRIKKLTGDVEEIEHLKSENENLHKEIEELKSDINLQMRINKELSRPMKPQSDSPNVRLNKAIFKQKCEISDLNDANAALVLKLESQARDIGKMKENMANELEIFTNKLDTYKQMLDAVRQEKEDIENQYVMFQTEVNKPDFSRQGNSLYVEVEDRRVLVEKKLLEFKDEIIRLRSTNKSLRSFLEDTFEEYSKMKDEDINEINMKLYTEIENLNLEKQTYEYTFARLKEFYANIDINCTVWSESMTIESLQINNDFLKRDVRLLNDKRIADDIENEKLTKRNNRLYATNMKLFKENAALMTNVADLEGKLDGWIAIASEDLMKQHEAKMQEIQDSLKKGFEVKETVASFLPPMAFGPYYGNAEHQDVLIFDVFGRPIKNRLTRRVLSKYEDEHPPEPEVVEEAPVVVTLLDEMKKDAEAKAKRTVHFGGNSDTNEPTKSKEPEPDCTIS